MRTLRENDKNSKTMKPYHKTESGTLYFGDVFEVLKTFPAESVNCCVTSPPYWGLRDYGVDGQIGLEKTPEEYIDKMVKIFSEVKRILRSDGTLWLNLGDSYAGSGKGAATHPGTNDQWKRGTNKGTQNITIRGFKNNQYKPKDLIGIPWRVAFALQSNGWYLRQDIIWSKPNPMPESVKDRCTKAHEYIFLLSKSTKYYFDIDAIKEDASGFINPIPVGWDTGSGSHNKLKGRYKKGNGNQINYSGKRNKRSVWNVSTPQFKGAHFATFPPKLIEPCILAGCPAGGMVLDPFIGSGTTAIVAYEHDRKFIGIDLNKQYLDDIAIPRIEKEMKQLKLF